MVRFRSSEPRRPGACLRTLTLLARHREHAEGFFIVLASACPAAAAAAAPPVVKPARVMAVRFPLPCIVEEGGNRTLFV